MSPDHWQWRWNWYEDSGRLFKGQVMEKSSWQNGETIVGQVVHACVQIYSHCSLQKYNFHTWLQKLLGRHCSFFCTLTCKWLVWSDGCSLQTFTQWLSDTNSNIVWLVWGKLRRHLAYLFWSCFHVHSGDGGLRAKNIDLKGDPSH